MKTTLQLRQLDDKGMSHHALVGFHKYKNYLLHYANPYNENGATMIPKHSCLNDCPSLYSPNIWPNAQNGSFKEERILFSQVARKIKVSFSSVVDQYMEQELSIKDKRHKYTKIKGLLEATDAGKLGSLLYYPTHREEPLFFWHNDTTIFTCLMQDGFFDDNGRLVGRPENAGLY